MDLVVVRHNKCNGKLSASSSSPRLASCLREVRDSRSQVAHTHELTYTEQLLPGRAGIDVAIEHDLVHCFRNDRGVAPAHVNRLQSRASWSRGGNGNQFKEIILL